MMTTSFAWLPLLLLLFYVHDVHSEKLQFEKTPPKRQILPVGSNLTIDCSTNNDTAKTAVYYRRSVKWKKIETVPGIKVTQNGSVYTLRALTRRNKGQYQCRASGGDNSTETAWPDNAGIVIIRGTLDKEKGQPDSKVKEKKKTKNVNTGNKKPGQKPGNKKKRIDRKRPGKRRPGSSKPGSKIPGNKRPLATKSPGSKRPGNKRPGTKRPGTKRPGGKRPGTKRPPGGKRPGTKRPPGGKRPGTKRPGTKRPGQKTGGGGKRPGPKKLGLSLKALKNPVTVNVSSLAVLKCTARVQGDDEAIMTWYRRGTRIGCSKKEDLRCALVSPAQYRITYKAHNTGGDGRKKYVTYLRIPKTRRARDKGIYVCEVRYKQARKRQSIRLKIVRSS